MKIIDKAKDKIKRHQERHTALGYKYVISDSIDFINADDWDCIAKTNTIFLSRNYLTAIEKNSPQNTSQRYAIAYCNGKPSVIVSCQIAEISGESLLQQPTEKSLKNKLAKNYHERVLVCGNLVSSGLHGFAYTQDMDPQTAWRTVAEILYKIRQAEKLTGKIDFVMVKDIKQPKLEDSTVLERFSYRRIQTDPDMVLELNESVKSFDDYLAMLTSKYRSRIKKIIKTLESSNFITEKLTLDEQLDKEVQALYLQVENKSATRLATLPEGYFLALQENLGENFSCYGLKYQQKLVGFITTIKDQNDAVAYYVGLDYAYNAKHPIYFRLLQLVIQSAIDMKCQRILFGRTALEPKASLGAKPVDTYVWARHRVPVVNFIVRKLFRNMPYDMAPERKAIKH
jgi:predicted N-acyltransferase